MKCELCSKDMRRVRRESLVDYFFGCLCFFPYRCPHCQRRRLGIHMEQAALFYGACSMVLLTLIVGVVWYKAKHRPAPAAALSAHAIQPGLMEVGPSNGSFGPINIPAKQALSNADIADLAQAHLAGDVVTRLIRTYPHNFQIDPKSLIELKKAGTPDLVISAMIDATVNNPSGQQAVTASFHPVPF